MVRDDLRSNEKEEFNNVFATIYNVELLFEEEPFFLIDRIAEELNEICGKTDINNSDDTLTSFFFTEYLFEYGHGLMPAQFILTKKPTIADKKKLELSLQQTWDFERVEEKLEKIKYVCMFSDFFSSCLDYTLRVDLLNKTLSTILRYTNCIAVHFPHSQKIADPHSFIERLENGEYLNGVLNVRFYKLEGTDGEIIMDTIGLSSLGLLDFQCHYKNIDPSSIAGLLYNYGYSIFNNRDIFEDGDTIEGLIEEQKWQCQHEVSLIEPTRIVINVMPEDP